MRKVGKLLRKLIVRILSVRMSWKMGVVFGLLAFLVFNGIRIIFAGIYERELEQNAVESFESAAYLYGERMGNLLDSTEAIVRAPFYFQQMQDELVSGETLSSESLRNIYYALISADFSNSSKFVVMLWDGKGKQVFVNASIKNSYISQINPQSWMKRAGETNGATVFMPIDDEVGKFSFIVARNIINIESFDKVGFIVVAIPKAELQQIHETVLGEGDSCVVIYNDRDEILFSSLEGDVPEVVQKTKTDNVEQGNREFRIDTSGYLGHYAEQSNGKYKILIYGKKEVLFGRLYELQLEMNSVAIMAVVAIFLLTGICANSVTKPLRKITTLMERVENGDWSVRFHAKYTDEIGVMGRAFNSMLERMNELMEHIVSIESVKKQVEIDSLKGQINPHFMYNTLETFRMMAIERDDDELADLIWRFGKMLRYNITTMNEMATIRSEMEYMQYYIDIQNSRYQNQIQLCCEVEEGLEEYQIIKLLIQPAVENAVFHGLCKSVKFPKRIKIKVYRAGKCCVIEVSDNGVGISPDALLEIRESLKLKYTDSKSSRSVGLRNVNERITLYYGSEYGMEIEPCAEVGVVVRLRLPYLACYEE